MKNWKNLLVLLLASGSLLLTGCLHIIEEVTFRNDKSGTYKMTIDMSEVKSMMDAFANMGEDSTATDSTEMGDMTDEPAAEEPAEEDNSMAAMGEELTGVTKSLKGVPGITNVQEMNDTSTYMFGYSFDFANVEALNKALKIINKEKYDAQADQTFKFTGKSFERLPVADIGAELKKALSESDEGDEESMEMVKMFFAEMTYEQIYHFPDRNVKKSSNKLSELDPSDTHTVKITLKPFDEEQQKQKPTVATKVTLK